MFCQSQSYGERKKLSRTVFLLKKNHGIRWSDHTFLMSCTLNSLDKTTSIKELQGPSQGSSQYVLNLSTIEFSLTRSSTVTTIFTSTIGYQAGLALINLQLESSTSMNKPQFPLKHQIDREYE